jgi:hypothetical protein
MGILDEAIRDHLELKRRGGAAEGDLRRLEDEAFGPPGRPGEPERGAGAPQAASAVAEEPSAAPEPGTAEAPTQAVPSAEGEGIFHDFAAEEGLVSGADAAPATPAEKGFDFEAAEVELDERKGEAEEGRAAELESPQPEPEAPTPPHGALSLDDTQPHDMETELAPKEEGREAPPGEDLGIEEDLELDLDDEDLGPSTGTRQEESGAGEPPTDEGENVEVVEEVEVADEVEPAEERGDEKASEGSEDSADDVLEETPDFLRETPEHDRLWFEQKPPKDFDFDE